MNQGITLKHNHLTDCPVMAKFKWVPDRMGYLRSRTIKMHHNHAPMLRDKQVVNNKHIENELKLYLKCGLSVSHMTSCINKKFGVKVQYRDVYNIVRGIKRVNDDKGIIKESSNEFEQLIEMLESFNKKEEKSDQPDKAKDMKESSKSHKQLKYAYEIE